MGLNIHFTQADWQRVSEAWQAWWDGRLSRPLVVLDGLEPPAEVTLPEKAELVANLPDNWPAAKVVEHYRPRLEATRYYGDSWPRWRPTFGPAVIAGFLGARPRRFPDTVWYEAIDPVPIQELHFTFDNANPLWQRTLNITRAAVEQLGDQVCIGFTDLVSNLDVLGTMVTPQQMLIDMLDAPEEVERLMDEITTLWRCYYDEVYRIIKTAGKGTCPWAPIWSPGRCYMLQSDLSYGISPRMFDRFVYPDLEICADTLDHAFYHMDGKGQIPHLERLLKMEKVRGIQWIQGDGAPPAEEWLPLLRRIRAAGKLCQVYVSPQGALTIARELGGNGFVFYIEGTYSRGEAQELLEALCGTQARNLMPA